MGLAKGDLVLEVGHDGDCDSTLRDQLMSITETIFFAGTTNEVVDAVILWWRDSDGDLVDGLMDVLTFLTEHGSIWVMTPKAGRAGHVEPSEIQDAALIAGLSQTSTIALATDWSATHLVARKSSKR